MLYFGGPFIRIIMRLGLAGLLFFTTGLLQAQLNIQLVGQLDYQALRGSDLSNLWGYTDEFGTEYALVGVNGSGQPGTGGISVVSLEDPANPTEVFFFAGPNSIWREIKVWDDHAYITTEAESGGITIVDLSPLPQSTDLPAVLWNAPDWNTSHSLFIDENGRLYLHGSDRDPGNGGVIMYDLTQDPMNPVEVGSFDQWYCHDSFARDNILYAAHIYEGFFSIVDVSDPANPILLGTQTTPNNFTHNTWLDDTGDFLFTTDERTNSYVGAYNISDPSDIFEVDRLRSDNGSGAIPHNTYWLHDNVVQSYYTYGVSIYDATYPNNMVEVGSYDTSPFSGDGFNGAWGVYPFFDSGLLIISDIEGGLFVLDPTYVQPCWLEGSVTNSQTGAPISGATLDLVSTTISATSGTGGIYTTGYHTAGNYAIQVSAQGYAPTTIFNVELVNGQITTQDIQLVPLVPFDVFGNVVAFGTGVPLEGAQVVLSNADYTFTAVSNVDGEFVMNGVYGDDYVVTSALWGWRTVCLPPQSFTSATGAFTVTLEPGYYDDMVLDMGWTVTGSATDGLWERGIPVGTLLGNTQSNPAVDVANDCGERAYVTGNGGGTSGSDDVDGGSTVLRSPLFDLSSMIEPHVRYHLWYFNGGGAGNPNDEFVIELSNGSASAVVQTITSVSGMSQWIVSDINVEDFILPTATMRLTATAVDNNPGHVVEAGFDRFEVVDLGTSGLPDAASSLSGLWPNPNTGRFAVYAAANSKLEIIDAMGRIINSSSITTDGILEMSVDAEPGTYTVRITDAIGTKRVQRMIITR